MGPFAGRHHYILSAFAGNANRIRSLARFRASRISLDDSGEQLVVSIGREVSRCLVSKTALFSLFLAQLLRAPTISELLFQRPRQTSCF